MKLKPIGSNMTTLTLNDGTEILFSYETPVAGRLSAASSDNHPFPHAQYRIGFFRTAKKWSSTTTRHINKYLEGCAADVVPQDQIESLVGRAF
jgi:hypothetical protein